MTNFINQTPYLRTSREFPSNDIGLLTVQIDKSYIDTATAVNNRTIGLFPSNAPAITGEKWFIQNNDLQQTLRQVYPFSTTATITHNIPHVVAGQFIRGFGSYTDGTNTYGLIYGSNTAIAGQVGFYITSTQIIFVVGAGAPAVTKGNVIIEWLSLK